MPTPHLNAATKLQENRGTMQYDMIYRHASQVTHRNRRRNLDRRARGTDTKRSIPRDLRQSDKPTRKHTPRQSRMRNPCSHAARGARIRSIPWSQSTLRSKLKEATRNHNDSSITTTSWNNKKPKATKAINEHCHDSVWEHLHRIGKLFANPDHSD